MELTFSELREKMIFNVVDGKRLGRLIDMAFSYNGGILGLIVPDDKKIFKCIGSENNIFIPWNCIVKIGEDAILVRLGENQCGMIGCNQDNTKICR